MNAQPGTPEGDELDALVRVVEAYESKYEPMGYPTAIEAIQFRMEQAGIGSEDLIPCIGSRAEVAEVLAGERAITPPMARSLHERLGIPVETLLREPLPLPDDQPAARS